MKRFKALLNGTSLKRGDMLAKGVTFAYVADDGKQIAAQEPGENARLIPGAAFAGLEIVEEPETVKPPKHIVIFREHGRLHMETQYIGPFDTFEDAYEYLCQLPALGIEKHGETVGCKFIHELQKPDRLNA